MPAARRQHRASPRPRIAANGRGIADALAALYSPDSLSEEQRVATEHALSLVPYQQRQPELALVIPEPDA